MKTDSAIRLAAPSDEAEVLHLLKLMWQESGWRPLDIDAARETFALAFDRKGASLWVIGAPGHIRAMTFLKLARSWYTREYHIEELFCWVHPEHRASDYHKILIEKAKLVSDEISTLMGHKVPLLMGVLTNRKMEAKVRLYRRFFGIPVGAFFVHNAPWVSQHELTVEDFFRVPALARRFFRPSDRAGHDKRQTKVS